MDVPLCWPRADYKVAWSTVGAPGTWLSGIKGVIADEAVADNGASRWDNFFVKANQFLLESPGTGAPVALAHDTLQYTHSVFSVTNCQV
jgi:hypothetical protein